MKLTSKLLNQNGEVITKEKVISDDCTMSQAFTMIEAWCNDNDAICPSTYSVWMDKGDIRVNITTKDLKYTNVFYIK